MKKIIGITLLIMITIITGCSNQNNDNSKELKNIKISVYDKEENKIYNEDIKTKEKNLFDAITSIEELEVKYENSQYGSFITTIKGINQENNYYWNYYVNGKYATVGVVDYIIKNNDVFEFKIEKYEEE